MLESSARALKRLFRRPPTRYSGSRWSLCCKALAELGKARKTTFLCRRLHSLPLRREIHVGLNGRATWPSSAGARRGSVAVRHRRAVPDRGTSAKERWSYLLCQCRFKALSSRSAPLAFASRCTTASGVPMRDGAKRANLERCASAPVAKRFPVKATFPDFFRWFRERHATEN
jgi:hypothetical protein